MPGGVVLGAVVGLGSLVPGVGILVAGFPIVLLAAGLHGHGRWPLLVLAGRLRWSRRWRCSAGLNRRVLVVGPAPTLLAAIVGFEAGGVGVALLGAGRRAVAPRWLAELAPDGLDDRVHRRRSPAPAPLRLSARPGPTATVRAAMARERIYTKTGDDGTTGLFYGGRVRKDSELPRAYGSVDEAQAGWAWPAPRRARAASSTACWWPSSATCTSSWPSWPRCRPTGTS